MGMYTELVCAFEVKSDNKQVINILRYMLDQVEEYDLEEQKLPDHELFKTSRWEFMLRGDSYYFDGQTYSELYKDNLIPGKPAYYLTVRCNFKNYDDEINKFIDWIKPYIEYDSDEKGKKFIGYSRYETDIEPKLIFV